VSKQSRKRGGRLAEAKRSRKSLVRHGLPPEVVRKVRVSLPAAEPPPIRTAVTGLSEREWEQVEAAAQVLLATCPPEYIPCGSIILPGRPNLYLLRWDERGERFRLEEARGD
jgi:hypothetical protein